MAATLSISGWLMAIAQTLLFVAVAPLFAGWIKQVKCWLENRQAPVLTQSYRDLTRLFSKRVILAENASIIFRITPYLVFGTTILAAAVTPFISVTLPTAAITDAIALTGFFAFARFFLVLAGMDIGTAFGGMGASREMTISVLAEPVMLMMVFTVSMVAASTNLTTVITFIEQQMVLTRPSLWFAAFGFLLVTLSETGRIPVDNPATHLELTMIHEAMILEYSGRLLAFLEWAAQLKLLIYAVLAINIFNPWGIAHSDTLGALLVASAALAMKLCVFGVLLAMVEAAMAKMRFFRVPVFLTLAFTLALGGMLSYVILEAG